LISRAAGFGSAMDSEGDFNTRGPLFAHQIGRSSAVEKACAMNGPSLESFPLTQKKVRPSAAAASVARPAVGPDRFRKKGDHV